MTCTKKPFTYRGARDALLNCRLKAMFRHNGKRREARIYACRECGAWHLTSAAASREAS